MGDQNSCKKERHNLLCMQERYITIEHANIDVCQLNFEYQTFKNRKGWNTLHDFCLDLQCRWVSASCQKYTTSLQILARKQTDFAENTGSV